MKEKKKRKSTKKPLKWFYIVLILIPVLFFTLLELGLQTFDYGKDLSPWIVTNNQFTPNPDLTLRYFSNIKNPPATIEDVFDIEKKENAYRIFILGGSSAAGFPYMPLGSFSRYIHQRLRQNYPDRTIEVVNLGIAAVNSYTILDLLPEVIKQKPDAILFYAGHNEYYGALGVGSLESYGRSRTLVKAMLFLNQFKTFQLIKDFMQMFGSDDISKRPGTLMAKMAEKKVIPYKSDLYNEGINQFRLNLEEIIEVCKNENIPLILGTLTSNEKDNPPFVNCDTKGYMTAEEAYTNGQAALQSNNNQKADSLFKLAKDLDALRFRAPSEMNDVIVSLSESYGIPLANIDSAFHANCKHNIVGNELMTDHLHPTLEGYQLMGKTFYESLNHYHLLPKDNPLYPFALQDSITTSNYLISNLDLQIADYTIKKLKNDYPFVKQGESKPLNINLDSLTPDARIAFLAATNQIKWADAHITRAKEAEDQNDIGTFAEHMSILISQYPNTIDILNVTIQVLLKSNEFDLVLPYLFKRYALGKNPFLSKWIGTILFQHHEHAEAIKYIQESLDEQPYDTQNLYNLAAIYALEGDFETARMITKRCLEVDPNHPQAKALLEQIQ